LTPVCGTVTRASSPARLFLVGVLRALPPGFPPGSLLPLRLGAGICLGPSSPYGFGGAKPPAPGPFAPASPLGLHAGGGGMLTPLPIGDACRPRRRVPANPPRTNLPVETVGLRREGYSPSLRKLRPVFSLPRATPGNAPLPPPAPGGADDPPLRRPA
jgi:hypothetical protein